MWRERVLKVVLVLVGLLFLAGVYPIVSMAARERIARRRDDA